MFSTFTNKTTELITETLDTNIITGLSSEEASNRIKIYGPNALPQNTVNPWHIFFRQFKSSFMYLLIGAAVLSFALGEIIEGWTIILFLCINSALGFYQEYKSEKTVELLKKYITTKARVRRGTDIESVPSSELVPGDIVLLEAGDNIPADIRIVSAFNLVVDEESLTGESIAVTKNITPANQEIHEAYQAHNIGFSGTTVISGKCEGVVIATGKDSMMGTIAALAGAPERESAFEKELRTFSTFILYLVVGTLLFIFITNIILKGFHADILNLAIFSIALAVSVVPEALPVVMAFSLSRGARHLAKNHVILKRLSALEDLGGVQILCTDKTGTITENKLTVHRVSTMAGIKEEEILFLANQGGEYLRSLNEEKVPDPFDTALWESLSENDQQELVATPPISDIPFDPVRKKNSVLITTRTGDTKLVVRGALEAILESTSLSSAEKQQFIDFEREEGLAGRRTIAVGSKHVIKDAYRGIEDEQGLIFGGCISFIDPIKESTAAAIHEAIALKVRIKILTGDSKEVTGVVAHTIGLAATPGDVLTAKEFFALPEELWEERLETINAFARVSPEQKYKLIQLLQKKYQVGFLGEGINDAPALKIANVALVVDSASDISREVADVILLEKSLSVVIKGIGEGRSIFTNTIKYITSTLSSNFGNFYSVAISSLFIPFLPMLPLQILLVNLLSDFPAIAIASDNVESRDLSAPHTYNIRKIIVFGLILGAVSTVFDFITFASFYKISPESLQTHWFIVSILTELLFFYSIRSKKFFLNAPKPGLHITVLTILAGGATIIVPFTEIGHRVFHFISPTAHSMGIVFAIVGSFFVTIEASKLIYYRFNRTV